MGDTMADKNYLHTAYANSADGTDGFTTVYPNFNLLTGTSSSEHSYISDFSTMPGYPNAALFAVNTGSTYTYSIYLTKLTGSFIFGYWGYDSNKNYAGWFFSRIYSSMGKASWTFTVPNGISYIYPHIVHASDDFACTAKEEKLEQGSTATPYMPSASEVTTADWPKYIGTYVDTNPTSSTNPSKYVWDEMKYRVYLDGVPVGGSKLLSFDLENLKAGTSYNVQVSQINGNVESDKSESIAFKTTLPK